MTRRNTLRQQLLATVFAISSAILASPQIAQAQHAKLKADLVLVDPGDKHAVRNVNNVLALYEMMINENKAEEGTARFLTPGYIQHDPLIADGSAALEK